MWVNLDALQGKVHYIYFVKRNISTPGGLNSARADALANGFSYLHEVVLSSELVRDLVHLISQEIHVVFDDVDFILRSGR